MYQDMYEQGGITGGPNLRALRQQLQGGTAGPASAPPMQVPADTPPPIQAPGQNAPGGLGSYANQLEGFDSGKLNDANHRSPKYQIARALSNFNPRQGVTPEVLAALNALGIGQFTGSGDRVTIANGDPRFEGVTSLDLVRGFNDPNGTGGWQYGVDGPAPAQGAGGGGAPSFAGGLNSMLTGDPLAGIQAAIAKYGGPSRNLQALLAQLSGGQ